MEREQKRQKKYEKSTDRKNQKLETPQGGSAFIFDPELAAYCTERQLELLTAWQLHGSKNAAARAFGISPNNFNQALQSVERKAANAGYDLPTGQQLAGVSTLYGPNGELKLQWVKSSQDKAQQEALFAAATEAFAEKIKPLKPIKLDRRKLDYDLLCAYPVGDHHIGCLALQEEAGADYNIEIAEELLLNSFAYLLNLSAAKHCLIPFLGDFLHTDGIKPVTPTGGNLLDTSTRFFMMVRIAIRIMRTMIESAAKVHETVKVIVTAGNHDLSSAIFLRECLWNLYEGNQNITVDRSPSHFHYHSFGKTLIGCHHGHGSQAKLRQLPLIMATDVPQAWGQSEFRYVHTGHVHSDNAFDVAGCRVESHRILAPGDAWSANNGYRSSRDMKSILYSRDHGEIGRHTVNPAFLGQQR